MAKTKRDWTVQNEDGSTSRISAYSQAQADAIGRLRRWLKPGDRVWTVLRHRSASGMSRTIDIVKVERDGERGEWMAHLGYNAAIALGWRYDHKREGVKVQGCGMDMGFALVYELGRVLFPEGFKVDGRGRNGDMSGLDSDGGYALKQAWM